MRQNAFFLLKVIKTAVFCEFFNKNIINPVYFIVGYYYNFFIYVIRCVIICLQTYNLIHAVFNLN